MDEFVQSDFLFLPIRHIIDIETPRLCHFSAPQELEIRQNCNDRQHLFMSSLNDTYEGNLAEYLSFPSAASKGSLLCVKGNNIRDGSNNSYALAWPEALPDSAILVERLTFISDTYYDYTNLWNGICAMTPFVGWSIRNQCLKPRKWVLYHWGELRDIMGPWIENLMQANFGQVNSGRTQEMAVVMRHNMGKMGDEAKIEAFDLLRCKARISCGINPKDGMNEVLQTDIQVAEGEGEQGQKTEEGKQTGRKSMTSLHMFVQYIQV